MRGSAYSKDAYYDSMSLGFKVATMAGIRQTGIPALIERIGHRVGQAKVFVTFDIDVVDPAFAPGTGTPAVAGLLRR